MSVPVSKDLLLISAAAFLRSFTFGLTGVVLGIYLFRVGLSSFNIGMVIAAGLAGSALATVGVTTKADRAGRRRTLVALSLLGALGALALALTPPVPLLLLMAFVGMLNGTGTDRSAAFSLEQAIIPGLVPDTSRTWGLSWYNVVLDTAGSLGALAAALPLLLQRWLALPLLTSYRAVFFGCAFLGVVGSILYPFASDAVEVSKSAAEAPPHHISPATKKVVTKLAGLFSLDAFGGGFLTDALVAYWFFRRFGVAEENLGVLFFAVHNWGLNLERFVPRERVWLRWSSPTLDSFLYDLSRAGRLTGVGEMQQGKGIEITPYATGETKQFYGAGSRAWQGAVGGELTWKITPQLVTVFTANTDFAETEVDTRQINLTRFPLFFPEKRAFFLEGANQYDFGLGLARQDSPQFIPFFSRNVGLLDGAQIPINAGIKLNGRVGKWNLGILDVQTRETIVPDQVVQDLRLPSAVVPGTNLFAGRVSYDFNENLRIGTIVTHGDPEAVRNNTLAGIDAVWRTSKFLGNKNLQFGAWTATSQGDVGPGSKVGWGLSADYPNDLLDCNASVNQFGIALEPLLGFLPRPGTRRTDAFCAYQPRPSKDGPFRWIRQEFFENEYVRYTDPQGVLESWEYFMAPINVRFESGDRFEFNWNPHGEILLAPFAIAPGVVIPPGSYQFTRYRLEAQTGIHRPLQFGNTTWFGSFFDGHLTQWQNYLKWTSPKGRVQLEADVENDFGRLPQGNFVQRLWQLQGAYAWNPNLVLSSFIQYDTESQNVGTNTRLRWTIKPGNDLFIVWNRGWQRLVLSPSETSIVPQSDVVAVKIRWTFRK